MSNKSKNVKKQTEISFYKKNGTKTKTKSIIKNVTVEESAKRTKRIIVISVSIVLALAIIFGAVLGIITAVRNASYVMKLDRVGIDKGVASFLISIYKYDFMIYLLEGGVEATEDTEEFWSSSYVSGTYGDLFDYESTRYLKSVIAANALFDQYAELSEDDEYKIDFAVEEVLNRKCDGSKQTFNELTAPMGFDFKDFRRGSEMLYKMRVVCSTVFGEGGSKMQTEYADYCESFYNSNYIRAKILFIRTEDTYVIDEETNKVVVENGKGVTRPLEEHEKAERLADINRLDKCIEAINKGSNFAVDDFNSLLAELGNKYSYENVVLGTEHGYYFAQNSQYAKDFGMSDIISEAFKLEEGEITTHEKGAIIAEGDEESDSGYSYKCYIYRLEKEDKAYQNSSLKDFFYDFNSLASISLYEKLVDEKAEKVEIIEKKWSEIIPSAIPYNYDYRVNSFGN